MSALTLTNYDLPKEFSTILFKTLGETVTIKNWTTAPHLISGNDITLIISKHCSDLLKFIYNHYPLNSRTVLISENFTLPTINTLVNYNLLSFIDYNDLTTDILETALDSCATGNLFISKTILALYKNGNESAPQAFTLSKREMEILRLIGEELTTKEIASQLYLSKRTVDTHRQNLMRKLNVRNNVGLIKAAILNSLICRYILLGSS
ncbi:helix-turn-helix transcriptional regulator [Niabella drilacis]|uniref:Regulatory protein, luxR family n=1 Tax=Niabella drilacis (strain DSM 25811 / CCM 8410 / CCUG 62505 / LMG 26954 / E90) TaxID=1285928 RepID=A0A1G6URI7_NIADE|nr:response regulator transcription factor [Niabella drilacis]SDD43316.1 regulatory protein, luxR family [Niabella drilacis]